MKSSHYIIAVVVATSGGFGCSKDSPTDPTSSCSFTLAPASASFEHDGGTGTVAVTTTAACAWTAASSASWAAITDGAAGTGSGTVRYTVSANHATDARNATLTIGGSPHALSQRGRPQTVCSYELSPGSASFNKDAATGSFTVSAPDGCGWTAASNAGWLTVTSGAQGSGNGAVNYAVGRNTGTAGRTAAITVEGRTFTVSQSGDLGSCQFSAAPVQFSTCLGAGSMTAVVTADAGCAWTVTSNSSWLTVTTGGGGTGSGIIGFSFTENYDAPRNGILMVRWDAPSLGQNLHLAQAGCRYGVTRSAISVPAAGASESFDVLQQTEPISCGGPLQNACRWSAESTVPWITITSSMPRTGDERVAFSVAPNTTTSARSGSIRVRDQVVQITQAGM